MFGQTISFILNKKYITYYPLISGVVMAVSFNFSSFWFLSFFGMIPFVIFLYQKKLNFKKVFIGGLFFGFVFMGSVLSWFWSTYPLKWVGIESGINAFFLILTIWFLSSIFFALFIATWTVIFYKFKKDNVGDIFFAASLWIVFEYIRALAFSILWISPVSLIGPHWTFGFLGYILAENKLTLSFASIGGIYLLSFIVILINIFIYYLLFTKTIAKTPQKKLAYILFLFIFIFIISFLSYTFSNNIKNGKKLKVAMVDTYLPSSSTFDKEVYKKHIRKIKRIVVGMGNIKKKPDIIIFPEDSRFVSGLSNVEKSLIYKNIIKKEALFIDSSDYIKINGDITYRLEYFNTKKSSDFSSKVLLVPFGEYLPYIFSYISKISGNEQLVKKFNKKRGFTNGKNLNNAVVNFQDIKIGALFCSEIVSNNLYRTVTKNGANLLVNIASQAVFKGSPVLYSQTIKMAKIHAVQNNRYFIQSMNFAKSFVVDNKGKIITKSNNADYGVTYSSVVTNERASLYNKLGDWILFISIIIIAINSKKYLYKTK